jgi:hypothetical protein
MAKDDLNIITTNEIPEGRFSEPDKGGLNCLIGVKDGKIALDFGKNVKWISMTKHEAKLLVSTLNQYIERL